MNINHSNKKAILQFIATVSVVAFLFHLVWEYAQCIPLFIHGELEPTNTVMLFATFGDVVLTWFAFIVVGLFSRDFGWMMKRWKKGNWAVLIGSAIVLSVAIELRALETGRWSYTGFNPVIFGKISIIPILQLLILFPLTFYTSKKIIKRWEATFL